VVTLYFAFTTLNHGLRSEIRFIDVNLFTRIDFTGDTVINANQLELLWSVQYQSNPLETGTQLDTINTGIVSQNDATASSNVNASLFLLPSSLPCHHHIELHMKSHNSHAIHVHIPILLEYHIIFNLSFGILVRGSPSIARVIAKMKWDIVKFKGYKRSEEREDEQKLAKPCYSRPLSGQYDCWSEWHTSPPLFA